MKVYKFGGGVIQDPESIRRLTELVQVEQAGSLVVVVSAIGRTTRDLEEILRHRLEDVPYTSLFQKLYQFHQDIIDQLLHDSRQAAHEALTLWQEGLASALALPVSGGALDQLYSRVMAWGEWLASKIIYHYLQEKQVDCAWLDAREYIRTESQFSNAQIDWAVTQRLVQKGFLPLLRQGQVILTQGFIGSNEMGATTTLGKEGSDFTGAILATALEADSLTIWKDVPGVMNADPKLFKEATKLEKLSYQMMAEMAFYGAKVVHPKTIQPLAAHHIPLYVRPFHHPEERGTVVTNGFTPLGVPVYVLQEDQVLIRISMDGGTFFDEARLEIVFHQLAQQNLRANLLERGAGMLTICLKDDAYQVKSFLAEMGPDVRVDCRTQVSLLTVMYGEEHLAQAWLGAREVLLTQQRPGLYQAVFQV